MEIAKPASATFLRLILVATLLTLSTVNCKKTDIENPFTEITTLDCRNLLIRSISLKDTIVEITIENTCKNCPQNNDVYDFIVMKDRQTGDTLNILSSNFTVPKNGQVMTYQLYTRSTTLPDLNTLQFDFEPRLCIDLTYSP